MLILCLAACERKPAAHLVELRSVEQQLLEPQRVTLQGSGFPMSTHCEAVLEGTLFPAGERPRPRALRAPCRARSESEATVTLPADDEGPFAGRIQVRFGEPDAAQVEGRLEHVVLRFGGKASDLSEQLATRQRTQRAQEQLGILGLELSERGVVVTRLDASGAAARAGLREGDQLLRFADVPVQLPSDVMTRPGERRVSITAQQPDEPLPRTFALDVESEPRLATLLLFAFASLGAALGALITSALPAALLWMPRRREYWLVVISLASSSVLIRWLVESLGPTARALVSYGGGGALLAALTVCLARWLRPTHRTRRDSTLAPLL